MGYDAGSVEGQKENFDKKHALAKGFGALVPGSGEVVQIGANTLKLINLLCDKWKAFYHCFC